VLEVDPTPIRRRRPDLPSRLAEVIDGALREEPAMASQTATAFEEALSGAVAAGHRPVSTADQQPRAEPGLLVNKKGR
jgi:hypothetical protein